MRADVLRLAMAHPGDLSALAALIDKGAVRANEIVAVIGKTEGNGGVNDFTRGYFTQTLMALLGQHLGEPAEVLMKRIPCVLSGGTEGVLSPHYVVLSTTGVARAAPANTAASSRSCRRLRAPPQPTGPFVRCRRLPGLPGGRVARC
jgi:cyanuric acid amidohydrolase